MNESCWGLSGCGICCRRGRGTWKRSVIGRGCCEFGYRCGERWRKQRRPAAYNSQVIHLPWAGALLACFAASAVGLDLSNARLMLPSGLSKREMKAVEMLRDEV